MFEHFMIMYFTTFRTTLYHDAVTLYAVMKKYRSTEYALSNSGWTILDSAEKIFNICKERVFNRNDGTNRFHS